VAYAVSEVILEPCLARIEETLISLPRQKLVAKTYNLFNAYFTLAVGLLKHFMLAF